MSLPELSPCIPSNSDIYGVGVRAATYAQTLFSFIPAVCAVMDKKVTPSRIKCLEKQTAMVMVAGFAILTSTIVQAATRGLSNFHATIILSLSSMNNASIFIYFMVHIYRRIGTFQELEENGTKTNTKQDTPRDLLKEVVKNRVLITGSFHLTLMAAFGIWLWSRPAAFGHSPPCSMSASVVILGSEIPLSSKGLRGWSIFFYSLLLLPGWNLIVPLASLIIPVAIFAVAYIIYLRTSDTVLDSRITLAPIILGLAFLFVIDIILLVGIEVAFLKNKSLLERKYDMWTLGQTLPLFLLLVPAGDLLKTIRNKRREFKLFAASRKGNIDVVRYMVEADVDINTRDWFGRTALMWAARNGHLDTVKFLVENGADVEAEDLDDKTACAEAEEHNFSEVYEYLHKQELLLLRRGSGDAEELV